VVENFECFERDAGNPGSSAPCQKFLNRVRASNSVAAAGNTCPSAAYNAASPAPSLLAAAAENCAFAASIAARTPVGVRRLDYTANEKPQKPQRKDDQDG